MRTYEERFAEAQGYYKSGLQNVMNKPEPEGQKFPVGSRVHIAKDLGNSMSHFNSDCDAIVEYVYAHAFGGSDIKSYSLIIDDYGSVAWYHEWQLTALGGRI